jgi:DNA-binding IclR family transcriptional regulator
MHGRTIAIDDLVQRVRSEYLEMPGLGLTLAQAARLLSLDQSTCARLLDALVQARFLTLTSKGLYVRPGSPRVSPETSSHQAVHEPHARARAVLTTRGGSDGRR